MRPAPSWPEPEQPAPEQPACTCRNSITLPRLLLPWSTHALHCPCLRPPAPLCAHHHPPPLPPPPRSERLDRSLAEDQRKKEACSINQSLSSLGDVFAALASRSQHIPYRNSKLTYLLQVRLPD